MFRGLHVLELASVLAGPSVGQFFAELGATVVKVENPATGGDVTRTWKTAGEKSDDRSAYFSCVNWGKKSVALDLTTTEGQIRVRELAQQADVIIASYKPGDAEKLGVGYDQLQSLNPSIIYGQISGYGSANGRVGYDAVIQAESGFMDMNGSPDGPPTKMPVALVDILAGHQLKEGLLVALLHRERTGEGCLVKVSLLQAALASLANQATNWLQAGKEPRRQGSAHPNIAPYGDSFLAGDGKYILLAIGSDAQFRALMKILGRPELPDQPAFVTNEARVKSRSLLSTTLGTLIAGWTGSELLSRLHDEKIPAGLIQPVKDALALPEALPLLLRARAVAGLRTFVATFGDRQDPLPALAPPPHLGEHTHELPDVFKRVHQRT